MPGFRRLLLVILAVISGACTQTPVEPEPLEFASDPRVLRGTWTGKDGNSDSLLLYLNASAPTADGYEIAGFFQLFGGFAVEVAGAVTVPAAHRASSATARDVPGCVAFAQARSGARDGDWELCGTAPAGSPPQFALTLTNRSAPNEVFTFSMTRRPNELADPNLLVRGNIIYVQGEPYTNPEPFRFTKDSHAVVRLYYSWSALGDAPSELVAETTLRGISSFPLEYKLEGDAEAIFARQGDYFLFVDVFSGAGDTKQVGDLTNEMYTPVPGPGAAVDVTVTGLEACGAPGAGGVCAEN